MKKHQPNKGVITFTKGPLSVRPLKINRSLPVVEPEELLKVALVPFFNLQFLDSQFMRYGEASHLQIQATDDTHVSACKGISAFEKGKKKKKKKKKKKCNKVIPM